jgi:hypothetical protein
MKRLLATVRCDVTLQLRHGFYYATAFVLVVCVALVSRIPSLDLGWLLPALVLGNLGSRGCSTCTRCKPRCC